MTEAYIARSLEPFLAKAVSEFPAVVLTGPRQSGKTTLLNHLFHRDYRYVSLEPPDVRQSAVEDPRGFLGFYPPPVIFDEVQYAPELLPYIKEIIDADRDSKGQFLLTGSQNLLMMERVTESLAGRAAILKLLPMSRREIEGQPDQGFPWEEEEPEHLNPEWTGPGLWSSFLRGGYPELAKDPERDIQLWHSSYIQTYLERDVRNLRDVADLSQFQSFLRMLAAQSGQLLNMSELSRDLGIALNTIKAWLSVLEATYQITVLRPYFSNEGKRLVKSPKVYFSDVGTLCYLTGLRDPEHAAISPLSGQIMETALVSEIVRTLTHRATDTPISFWRTMRGTEVDVVLEWDSKLIPIEAKSSSTPRPKMASGILSFLEDFGDRSLGGYVVHTGDVRLPLGSGVTAIPFGLF